LQTGEQFFIEITNDQERKQNFVFCCCRLTNPRNSYMVLLQIRPSL